MSKIHYNKRPNTQHTIEPMRVREEILQRCRAEIEPRWKSLIRFFLNKYLKHKLNLKVLGEGCHLGNNSLARDASLGNFSSFGPGCKFNGPIVIGDLTMLSTEVQVIGQDHLPLYPNNPMRIAFPQEPRLVTIIEADCWIGSRVTIMEGVTIGRGSIIGAASVVTKSIPPYSIAVGVPAKVIKKRFNSEDMSKCDLYLYGKEGTYIERDS